MDKVIKFNKETYGKECAKCYAFFEYQQGICPCCSYNHEAIKQFTNTESLSFTRVIKQAEDSFLKLLRFTEGKLGSYTYYGFLNAFNIILHEVKTSENASTQNFERTLNLYYALGGIVSNWSNGCYDFINEEYEGFYKDLGDLSILNNRQEDFYEIGMPAESNNNFTVSSFKATLNQSGESLELAAIALIHYYGCEFEYVEEITNRNADRIAMGYGHASGEKLMYHVRNATSDRVWRYGVNKEFKLEASNRRKRLKAVVKYLKTKKYIEAHKRALTEYNKLNEDYKKAFSKVTDN